MNSDEANALRGIIEQHGWVKVGDEFDAGTMSIIAVPNSLNCIGDCGIDCVFNTPDSLCPKFHFEAKVLPSCVTTVIGNNKNIVFVPKLEYLTRRQESSSMNSDEANALRGIIEQHGEVKAGDEFGDAVAVKQDPDAPRCGVNASLWCIFANNSVPCPHRTVESRVVASCTTGSPHVKKELVFVPKLEYLTWKLTQS